MSTSKVIIVTGASRGIGLAICHYLLKQSHKIVAVARSEQPLRALEQEYSGQVAVVTGDFSDLSLGRKVVDAATKTFQRIDGLIVNHGVLDPVQRLTNTTAEDWRKNFDVNFFSAVAISQAALPELRKTKGSIILVSSGAASNAYPTWGAYGASKAALNHLGMTLAAEEKDITTLSIRPGVVDTEMQKDIREKHNHAMDASDAAKFKELKETGGLLKPEQPGHVMARLAVEPPRDLTGKFLTWNAEELKSYQE